MSQTTETIISIAKENRVLRWALFFLSLAIAALAVALVHRRPADIWVVTSNGSIHQGEKEIFSWEGYEATRRALDVLFVPTDRRDDYIDAFYSDSLKSSVKGHEPKDRFISFQLKGAKSEGDRKISVDGILQRIDKPPVSMNVVLQQSNRTELNPFGLIVVKGSFDEASK